MFHVIVKLNQSCAAIVAHWCQAIYGCHLTKRCACLAALVKATSSFLTLRAAIHFLSSSLNTFHHVHHLLHTRTLHSDLLSYLSAPLLTCHNFNIPNHLWASLAIQPLQLRYSRLYHITASIHHDTVSHSKSPRSDNQA